MDYFVDDELAGVPAHRDPKTDEAKQVLMKELFDTQPEEVFYGRQIEVLFERVFFHWITSRALNELVAEEKIGSAKEPLAKDTHIRFFWSTRCRYWKRRAKRISEVVLEFSRPELGLGLHAELMFDAGLARARFVPTAVDVRSHGGKSWTRTGHDLDRIYERDGVSYGAEIKNTLGYIEREELETKLEMCAFFGVRPLFIMRASPKSYNFEVIRRGGFALVFGTQLYPFGHGALAEQVQRELGLPAAAPRALPAGTVERFARWHERKVARQGV